MKINKQAFELIGVTLEDYLLWCEDNNLPSYLEKTKVDFFTKVKTNQIVRDSASGKLKTLRGNSKMIIRG